MHQKIVEASHSLESSAEGRWRVKTVSTGLYDRIEPLVKKYASQANSIERTVLVLSVLTSGAFWALVSDAVPKSIVLVGAAISTVVTFLTIYMYSSGLNTKRKTAIFIYKEIGKFMADVRTNPTLTDQDFWTKYKHYDGMIWELEFGRADTKADKSARGKRSQNISQNFGPHPEELAEQASRRASGRKPKVPLRAQGDLLMQMLSGPAGRVSAKRFRAPA